MTTAYTSLLGLALPVDGELTGTWGQTVNNYITTYLDGAVAGTQIISGTQTAVTLSKTTGTSLSQAGTGATGSSQYQIIRCTGNPASLLTITVPAADKTYVVINATSTSQSVKIVGFGPTTGVTITSGSKAIVAWNGSDFVEITPSTISGTLPVANGGTGATTAATARTNLGATTVGANVLTLTNPSAITFPQFNADNTVSALDAASFRTAIGAGSGGGSVTSVSVVSTNGFTGTVANPTSTPAITLTTSITGMLYGNGTAISAATAGTNFVAPGGALGTPSSGTLSSCTVDGTNGVGYKNIPQTGSDKTTAYTLATGDVGKYVGVGTSGSIVVPTSTFANGDAISIFNNTTGNVTITTSAPTAYIGGTNTVKTSITLATRGIATILFVSATVCVVTGNVS